jgi:hypothetical protein
MRDPSQMVLNYLRTVGGRAPVARVMEATGLDRETILRNAGKPAGKRRPAPAAADPACEFDWRAIDWI